MVLYDICGFLVAGASAKADECRVVELQLEVALRCVVPYGMLVGIFWGGVLRNAPRVCEIPSDIAGDISELVRHRAVQKSMQ